ncbi:hypothetical protein F2P56_035984 [Juglans regia]|uniref:Uncharacterized protein n=1 Tax=Juglans regia TaxID=51240 RepID=A0A833TXT5_JUGRE|nr:hypothetical protein F2P56_035984 [Juglans regia]
MCTCICVWICILNRNHEIKGWQDVFFFIIVSLPIVTGTTLNYFLDDKINKAEILFPGVGCFLTAVCLGSFLHASNAADNKKKLESLSSDYTVGAEATDVSTSKETVTNNVGAKDLENGSCSAGKAKAGTAGFLIALENRRAIKVGGY